MSDTDIMLNIDGAVATITLNRPDKKNALTQAMWTALPTLIQEVTDNAQVHVVVLTGAGGAFAAGADISEFPKVYESSESATRATEIIMQAMNAVAECPKPVIAKIEGACIGGGCGLALTCDIRMASSNSKFGITPGKLGLAYMLTDTRRLVDAVGLSKAKDILYTGRILGAEEAYRIGLVDYLLPEDELEQFVADYTNRLAQNSSFSLRTTKDFMLRIVSGQMNDDVETQARCVSGFEAPDFQEGYKAFLEKRKPDFS
jgi:enoyl-CoA hydratase/carnithine racemase